MIAQVVELAETKYRGFNQHHVTEMLAEREGLDLSVSSVHRILAQASLAAPLPAPVWAGRPRRICRDV